MMIRFINHPRAWNAQPVQDALLERVYAEQTSR
jgi:hypothetical protein